MASRQLLRQVSTFNINKKNTDKLQRIVPAAIIAGVILFPKSTLHAEAPNTSEVLPGLSYIN